MDLPSLRRAISAASIRDDAYSILGDVGERYCLTHNGPYWAVFYSERGEHINEREFANESEACEALLSSLLADPTTRTRSA